MSRKSKTDEHDCIDMKHVPCEKARAYLAKHGKLCGVNPPGKKEKPVRQRAHKFLSEWFG